MLAETRYNQECKPGNKACKAHSSGTCKCGHLNWAHGEGGACLYGYGPKKCKCKQQNDQK